MYMIASNGGDWEPNNIGQVAYIDKLEDFDAWYGGVYDQPIATKREVISDADIDALMEKEQLSYYCDAEIVYVLNEEIVAIPDIFFLSEVKVATLG